MGQRTTIFCDRCNAHGHGSDVVKVQVTIMSQYQAPGKPFQYDRDLCQNCRDNLNASIKLALEEKGS